VVACQLLVEALFSPHPSIAWRLSYPMWRFSVVAYLRNIGAFEVHDDNDLDAIFSDSEQ